MAKSFSAWKEVVDFMKSDVYSLGMVMAEVINGTVPFQEDCNPGNCMRSELLELILRDGQRPELSPWAPDYLVALVHDAWALDPFCRPSSRHILETLEANMTF
ncbi:unnamed protein product [Choristocarpus tenellus]